MMKSRVGVKIRFLFPIAKFIDQLTKHIMDWHNGTENQDIALKAAFVLVTVCLQKPDVRR